MSPPVRIGIAGCGRITELGHLPAAAGSPAVEVTALADPDRARREALAAAAGHGARAFTSVAEMVARGGVDAVLVASPPEHHVEHARLATGAGLACLVEKPPAPDATGAQRLAELVPAPWIGFNRRFAAAGALAARVPADGPIELALAISYRRASWRPVAVRDDALADLGAHLTDLALFIAGGGAARARRATAGHGRAEIELELARGRALLRAATDRPHHERAVVREPGGAVIAEASTPGPVRGILARLRGREHPLVASLRAELEAFARAARGKDARPLATARDGVAAMVLVDEARAVAERP